MSPTYYTHYCANPHCKGATGFEVTWTEDTEIDPGYPLTDTCPWCASLMLDLPVHWGKLDEVVINLVKSNSFQLALEFLDRDTLDKIRLMVYESLRDRGVMP